MSTTIRWTQRAQRDRIVMRNTLANLSLRAAVHFEERIKHAMKNLRAFPSIGRLGELRNTRELVAHRHYRLVYRLGENAVTIIALHNVGRPWPPKVHSYHD
ncbi:type II toxin-antitoxin system RelE/ParE family toxin [Pandoraea iniqua]|uniref:type II toxin-antitoxin system RelE/ParE family toxin n=1 Tax=Pandoraea iniqua TaxID=2508288 RepID=UPI000B40056E